MESLLLTSIQLTRDTAMNKLDTILAFLKLIFYLGGTNHQLEKQGIKTSSSNKCYAEN